MADGSLPSLGAVATTCPYCGVGCGVTATPDGAGGAAIAGDRSHPANFGRLCSKGSALGETLSPATRLLHPEIAGERVSWDQAISHVADELARVRDQHGPGAIAFYLSGQLLTEDYYVANKLAKGFIGTPHVDTNSRLCMASSVAGHKRAFGADVVPGCYEDLDEADMIVLIGSNTAWCHPILYQRIQKARETRGTKVVNIDPRRTATSEGSDLQLSIAAGSDTALWNGLLVWLADHGVIDTGYIVAHTEGFDAAMARARNDCSSIADVARLTGLAEADIRAFYALWAATPRVVSCYSQGVNQAAAGTDKVNAIINCHLATGRIAKTGAGPLSLTGQPNAMGGREVGGLANMLAAHMGFSQPERDLVQRFWGAPSLVAGEGLKAVQMFEAIGRGEIKALWVMGTNPAVSLPRADAVQAALGSLEFFAVSEVVASNDTARGAGVRLPAHGWGEKNGTVTNSERRISRQRPFGDVAGEARADWWIVSRVAARLGFGKAFAFRSAADVFREHAALSGFENAGARVFDISGLKDISDVAFDELVPVQWPVKADRKSSKRVFGDGRYATANARARFVAVGDVPIAAGVSAAWPLLLNTGRIRDQWHTMTRTGLAPRLSSHIPEPFVEINPSDATATAIRDGYLARIETAHGAAIVKAVVTDRVMAGTLFAPIHWSAENSSGGRIGALVHGVTDPISGQPDSKATPANISAVAADYFGFIVTRDPVAANSIAHAVYWSRASIAAGYVTAFAVAGSYDTAREFAGALLPAGDRLTVADPRAGLFRAASIRDSRLAGVLNIAATPGLRPSQWLKGMLALDALTAEERRALLAGAMAEGAVDAGPVVCVCHQVGAVTIADAITNGCGSVEAVGNACAAGTNCGSCIPELKRMLSAALRPKANAA